jgi:hypothetical protein
MSEEHLILDNSVLSAFASGNWFHNLSFWSSDYEILTTETIWTEEFTPHHEYTQPDWLTSKSVDTSQLESKSVELGEPDWTLIRLAERTPDSILVSNDGDLITEAEQRDLSRIWGTKLLIQTFEGCGIDRESFDEGTSAYIADVHLPDPVAEELQSAEKM